MPSARLMKGLPSGWKGGAVSCAIPRSVRAVRVWREMNSLPLSHRTAPLGTPHARIARRSAVQTAVEGDVRATCSSTRRLQTSMMPSMVCLCPSDRSTSAIMASISQSAFSEFTPSSARPTEAP